MGTTSPIQVPEVSVDSAGVSAITTNRSAFDSRLGMMYSPATLAAIQPVHFHPLTSNQYLALFSRRWHTATPSTVDPGRYSAYTEDTTPGWVRLLVPSGAWHLEGEDFAIPWQTPADTVVLTDASSRASEYLYLLASMTLDDVTTGVVAHWWYNSTTSALTALAEEIIPSVVLEDEQEVVFDRGLWQRSPYLLALGWSSDDKMLYLARKPWYRIGTNRPLANKQRMGGVITTGTDPRWQYYTGSGWSFDGDDIGPVVDVTGAPVTTEGPVSVAHYRDRSWITTVAASGNDRSAVIYGTRGGSAWRQLGTVPLGSTADGSYLGGTLQLQTHLPPVVTSSEMMAATSMAAIPCVYSRMLSDADDLLENLWALLPIHRSESSSVSPVFLPRTSGSMGSYGWTTSSVVGDNGE